LGTGQIRKPYVAEDLKSVPWWRKKWDSTATVL
jgi:hypothetical protein